MSANQDNLPSDSSVTCGAVFCNNCKVRILLTRSYPPLPLNVLRSNQIPSKAEIFQTTKILQEEGQELQAYDEEIQRLHLTLGQLKDDREKLYRKREMRQSWFAPIRRLPAEMLGKIFDEVIQMSDYSLYIRRMDSSSDGGGPPKIRVTAVALTLSHVSSHWRNLAFSQKSIWSSIDLGLVESMSRDLCPLLRLHLNNATGYPLKMKIRDQTDMFCDFRPSEKKVRAHLGRHGFRLLQMLASHFSSCEELAVKFFYPEVLLYTMKTKTSFPLLHTLVCDRNEPIFSNTDPEKSGVPANFLFWDAVREAPLLRNVQLDEAGQSRHQNYIPWRQLTSLSANHVNGYTDLRFILSRSKRLEELRVGQGYRLSQDDDAVPHSHNDIEPISLPYLWKVDLFNSMPKAAHYALASLTAPSLRDLRISVNRGPRLDDSVVQSWDMGSLCSMIGRSSCHLTCLNLSVLPYGIWGESFALFVEALRSSALLECLEVRTGKTIGAGSIAESFEDDGSQSLLGSIFSVLAVSSSSGPVLLPRLRDIRIYERISASAQLMNAVLDTIGERTATGLRVPALDKTGDICPLTNVLIGISTASRCWCKETHDAFRRLGYTLYITTTPAARPLVAIEERLAAFEKDGTKCVIVPHFRARP
ncbi:hypothetical protein VNI00_015911 [Paramarasmius palmivorus]|uniref:F-box domain-containing protein n=1 Tax=Paramarasmius palmivorus TaxID=297713 RepID=A0AAW0BGF9_9AGAR